MNWFTQLIKKLTDVGPMYRPTPSWAQWANAVSGGDALSVDDPQVSRWIYEGSILEYGEHFEIGGEG